jgi:beta-phosphoglucomutase-like phosphatase (HAD superfamily)
MTTAAILDIDGTLVDTNYQHAIAWFRAFRRHRVTPPIWRIHRHIGMGGDQLVGAVAGKEVERRLGEHIRETEAELYMELISEVEPLEDARELIADLESRVDSVVLASSAKQHEVDRYLDLLDASARRCVDDVGRRRSDQARTRSGARRTRSGGRRDRPDGRRHHLGLQGGGKGRRSDRGGADRRLHGGGAS